MIQEKVLPVELFVLDGQGRASGDVAFSDSDFFCFVPPKFEKCATNFFKFEKRVFKTGDLYQSATARPTVA